jgi:hypothetical protein
VVAPIDWQELIDPRDEVSMDLSFVITGEAIPEPATIAMLSLGLGLFGVYRRRKMS